MYYISIYYQVMIQKHNRQMSFSLYISALAVSDTFFLLNGEASIPYNLLNNLITNRNKQINYQESLASV